MKIVLNNSVMGAVFLIVIITVFGCTSGTKEDDPTLVHECGKGLGNINDWHIEPGYMNLYPASNMTITKAEDNEEGSVMKVTWGSNQTLLMCELFAELPGTYDYGTHDGLIMKVKIDVDQNMMLAIRNPPRFGSETLGLAGVTWMLDEITYFYDGSWMTIIKPFYDAEDAMFGEMSPQGSMKEWLSASKAVKKLISLNPELNTAADAKNPLPNGNKINTTYTNLYKKIGLYRGKDSTKIKEEDICWIWEF